MASRTSGMTIGSGRTMQVPLRSGPNGLEASKVSDIQRTRILCAMVEVDYVPGSGSPTVKSIIARAKVSRRTFYELFDDRHDCMLGVFNEMVAEITDLASEAYHAERDWTDRVRAGLLILLVFFEREPELSRLCVIQSLAGDAALLARRGELIDKLAAIVDQGRVAARAGRELSPITAEGIVGAVSAILHTRLLQRSPVCPAELLGPLMSMIVLPYLGPSAAHAELSRPLTHVNDATLTTERRSGRSLWEDLNIRLTYRTIRALNAVAEHPGANNRQVGKRAGIADQAQISKLLTRLASLGVIENIGEGHQVGKSNAWILTPRGADLIDRVRGSSSPPEGPS